MRFSSNLIPLKQRGRQRYGERRGERRVEVQTKHNSRHRYFSLAFHHAFLTIKIDRQNEVFTIPVQDWPERLENMCHSPSLYVSRALGMNSGMILMRTLYQQHSHD